MTNQDILKDLEKSLTSLSDEKRREAAKSNYPSKQKILGVTVPNERMVLKELRNITKNYSLSEKTKLAIDMANSGVIEIQHIAFEYIAKDKKLLSAMNQDLISRMFTFMDNWVSVDSMGVYVLGNAWRMDLVNDEFIQSLLDSEDFWKRRLAIVATVSLNQKSYGAKGDAGKTLAVCGQVLDERNDMIVKALSWALRKLSTCDKQAVIEFLEENNEKLAPRVKREVWHKLVKGTKN